MNRFPLSAVQRSGYYFYRIRPDTAWRIVSVDVHTNLISFFGVSELDLDYIKRQRPQAELYGPIPLPPADAELDDQPYPF